VADIRLFAYGSGWGVPFETGAPFPLKLATWLRMAGVDFEWVVENDTRKGPKGKSPWIEWEGVRMGDSSLIIDHVAQRLGIDLDAHLTPPQRALAVAVQRMLEDHYHQCFEHQLFFGEGSQARLAEFRQMAPVPIKWVLPMLIRRGFSQQLHARGMGRHDETVIIDQGKQDLDALAELLGDQPFALGDEPSSLDACVFGFLGVTVYVEGDNPLFRHAAASDTLRDYAERMRQRYFPESLEVLPPLLGDPGPRAAAAEGAA